MANLSKNGKFVGRHTKSGAKEWFAITGHGLWKDLIKPCLILLIIGIIIAWIRMHS